MASDDTMTILQLYSPTMQLEDEDEMDDGNDEEDDHHHHTPRSHYLSRLSMCSSSKHPTLALNMYDDDDDDDDVGGGGDISDMGMDMARLSIECSSEGDGDEELSDGKEESGGNKGVPAGISSDSDKETYCYSLPATPPRRRRRRRSGARLCGTYGGSGNLVAMGLKEYASENEAQRRTTTITRRRSWFRRSSTTSYCCSSPPPSSSLSWTRRRLAGQPLRDRDRDSERDSWGIGLERAWDENNRHNKYGSVEEEEEEEEGGSECVVITRPKGGSRSLCMDLEEVKACRDLGFELDHERMMMMDTPTPGRISISMSAASNIDFDTSSGGNSPIANWRISSPGESV